MDGTIDVIRFSGNGTVTIPKELIAGATEDVQGKLRLSAHASLKPKLFRDGPLLYVDETRMMRVGMMYNYGTRLRAYTKCPAQITWKDVENDAEGILFIEESLKSFIEAVTKAWS